MTEHIPPKYHLGDRNVVFEDLPADVLSIGDWAYALCQNLKEIMIPAGCEVSSKAFEGCEKLESIKLCEKGRVINELPGMLAAAVLAWPEESGRLITEGSDKGLCEKADQLLPVFIATSDDLGFQPFYAGGEEDYASEDEERDAYIFHRRELKLRLCYERLLAAEAGYQVTDGCKRACEDYIRTCSIKENIGLALRYPDRKTEYCQLYLKGGYHLPAPADGLLDETDDAELRAMILKHAASGGGALSADMLMI